MRELANHHVLMPHLSGPQMAALHQKLQALPEKDIPTSGIITLVVDGITIVGRIIRGAQAHTLTVESIEKDGTLLWRIVQQVKEALKGNPVKKAARQAKRAAKKK